MKFSAVNAFDDDVRTSVVEINLRGFPTAEANLAEKTPSEIKIYPNPANNQLFVQANTIEPIEIQVFTLNGQLLLTESAITDHKIDVSNLSSGVYLIRIGTAKKTEILKFTKL